jgi:hypothetical protein
MKLIVYTAGMMVQFAVRSLRADERKRIRVVRVCGDIVIREGTNL